jgi:hypothetical protein
MFFYGARCTMGGCDDHKRVQRGECYFPVSQGQLGAVRSLCTTF